MQTDFYEERLRVFLEEFKKNTVAYSEKIEGFLYKPCEYKVGNELPVVDESFKRFDYQRFWYTFVCLYSVFGSAAYLQ